MIACLECLNELYTELSAILIVRRSDEKKAKLGVYGRKFLFGYTSINYIIVINGILTFCSYVAIDSQMLIYVLLKSPIQSYIYK